MHVVVRWRNTTLAILQYHIPNRVFVIWEDLVVGEIPAHSFLTHFSYI